ncbi:MAG: hypothetical protein AAFX53_18340 [Bacteroidota bacterium]
MALNKFEEHIKRQLESREIKPSDLAWKKVVGSLDDSPVQKSKWVIRFGIAAVLIGLLAISGFFLSSEKGTLAPEKEITDTGIRVPEHLPDNKRGEPVGPVFNTDENLPIKTDNKVTSKVQRDENPLGKGTPEGSLVDVVLTDHKTKEQQELNRAFQDSDGIIDAKISEVVAQVDILERNHKEVSDREIDSLLRKAQQELLEEKLFRKGNTVDAMALLTEVEGELEQSFRDQIFEKLKTSFVKVRTAVADRNN